MLLYLQPHLIFCSSKACSSSSSKRGWAACSGVGAIQAEVWEKSRKTFFFSSLNPVITNWSVPAGGSPRRQRECFSWLRRGSHLVQIICHPLLPPTQTLPHLSWSSHPVLPIYVSEDPLQHCHIWDLPYCLQQWCRSAWHHTLLNWHSRHHKVHSATDIVWLWWYHVGLAHKSVSSYCDSLPIPEWGLEKSAY